MSNARPQSREDQPPPDARYNRAGGRVDVTCADSEDEWVEVEIVDNGNGIPQPLRDRLFVPFGGRSGVSEDAEGNGLGLMVSRQLIQAMGGDIAVTDRPGGGTCVTLRLRAAK